MKNQYNFFNQHTIARDLIIRLILIISIVGAIQAIIFSIYYKKTSHNHLNNIIKNINKNFKSDLRYQLWDMHYPMISDISLSLVQSSEYLVAVRIVTRYNDTLEYPKAKFDNKFYEKMRNLIPLKKDSIFRPDKNEYYLGTVELWFTNKEKQKTEQYVILYIIIIIVLVIVVIIIGIYVILERLLNRPLKKLITNIKRISEGDYENLDLQSLPQSDINKIKQEVNKMATLLKEREKLHAEAYINDNMEYIDLLARWVVHNIKSPLQPIFNSTDPKIKQRAHEINRCLETYSKVTERRKNRSLLYHDINEIILASIDFSRFDLSDSNIQLAKDKLTPSLPQVKLDDYLILHVFIAIIQNACYALNEKYPLNSNNFEDKILDLESSLISRQGKKIIQIIFHDHGNGMSQEVKEKALNVNFSTKKTGTGIGLFFVSEEIKKHNGTLSLESVEGEYTKVIIDLPVV